jgi:hypothetical protein
MHIWHFSTIGGVKRVNLESGADLINLKELDQKLWTALSCPVKGLEIDHKTLQLIDSDNDGNVKVPEILTAIEWITSILKNADDLIKPKPELSLNLINNETEEGARLLGSAKSILNALGKPDATTISLEDTSDTQRIFSESRFNGDGIITMKSTEDESLKKLIEQIGLIYGTLTDRSGEQGITKESVDAFFLSVNDYLAWINEATATPETLPFAGNSAAAYEAYNAVKHKIDDYFLRLNLLQYQPSLKTLLSETATQQLAENINIQSEIIQSYPISAEFSTEGLPLHQGINPLWQGAVQSFYLNVVKSLLGERNHLSESDWIKIKQTFAAYEAWLANKKGEQVETLGEDYIRQIASGNIHEQFNHLIEQDLAVAEQADYIIKVEQLVRYYRDLYKLLKNFVTFYDFYSTSDSIFQAGTLYIDQRSCNLCIKVNDMNRHNTMVSFSGMYVIYCECTSKRSNEKILIAAALTNGDIDNLVVGRNALFYDKAGNDWNATVVKIIENPISIKQAFWSPYRKVSRFIENQINKFAAEQDSKSQTSLQKGVEELPAKNADTETPQPKPAVPFDIGKFVGIFAAIGLAIGAIGSVIASFISGLLGLVWWKLPFAIAGILLVISGPSMLMAYFKLRKRNLAPLLDANGWAINANVIVNIPFGNTLTHEAKLPQGAKVEMNDPFMTKKFPFKWVLIGLVLLIALIFYTTWKLGYMKLPNWNSNKPVEQVKDTLQ